MTAAEVQGLAAGAALVCAVLLALLMLNGQRR